MCGFQWDPVPRGEERGPGECTLTHPLPIQLSRWESPKLFSGQCPGLQKEEPLPLSCSEFRGENLRELEGGERVHKDTWATGDQKESRTPSGSSDCPLLHSITSNSKAIIV